MRFEKTRKCSRDCPSDAFSKAAADMPHGKKTIPVRGHQKASPIPIDRRCVHTTKCPPLRPLP